MVAILPYPDHPSSQAQLLYVRDVRTLRDLGTNSMSFSATHATLWITRTFSQFSEAMNEVRLERVYGGLHFMTADAQGGWLPEKVADYGRTSSNWVNQEASVHTTRRQPSRRSRPPPR